MGARAGTSARAPLLDARRYVASGQVRAILNRCMSSGAQRG
jgi:hypothetical protein